MSIYSERTHLGKLEEDQIETGIQLRTDDPISTVEGQAYIQQTENLLKIRLGAGQGTHIVKEGKLATGSTSIVTSPIAIAPTISRSRVVDLTTFDLEITVITSLMYEMPFYIRCRNTSANLAQVQNLVFPAPTDAMSGAYFTLDAARVTLGSPNFFVWVNINGESVPPVVPNRTAIEVVATAGRYEITEYTFGPASGITSGQHFLFSIAGDTTLYYLWFNKDLAGGDPLVVGRTGVQVQIVTGDTDEIVAGKVQLAMDALAGLTAGVVGNMVTTTTVDYGAVSDASNVNVGGLSINITRQGANPQTATEFAQAVRAAINTAAATWFTTANPVTPTLTITNASQGYAGAAENFGITGLSITVTTAGSGRRFVTFPSNVVREGVTNPITDTNLGVLPNTERLYTLIRKSNGNIIVYDKSFAA